MSMAIEVSALVKRYAAVSAVDGLDLRVPTGECFGLLGPNGAGKTTTVEILEGLIPATSGSVQVLGERWGSENDKLRQRIGVALQETQFTDKLTVVETIALFRSFYKQGRQVEDLLDAVSLREKRSSLVGKLSGGQKQRLTLACALAGNPELLFLDEPTTGLDPQSRRQVWDLVAAYKREGRTVLLTTHYMDEAEKLCDRVAVVDHGKVIALGTPDALIAGLGAAEVVEFSVEQPLSADELSALPGVVDVGQAGGAWRMTVTALHRALPALVEKLAAENTPLTSLTTHRATLEDVFVSLTGRSLRDS